MFCVVSFTLHGGCGMEVNMVGVVFVFVVVVLVFVVVVVVSVMAIEQTNLDPGI